MLGVRDGVAPRVTDAVSDESGAVDRRCVGETDGVRVAVRFGELERDVEELAETSGDAR